MKTSAMMFSFLAAAGISAGNTDGINRVGLDGKSGIPAPACEAGKDGIDRIHKVEQAGFELFPCQKPSKGTIMLCPGGGYSILAINHEGRDIARMLNGYGYDVAVLLYHVSSGDKTREMALDDAKKGLSLLQTGSGGFGFNTRSIGVMGFSAGGHLAARLAHETRNGMPPDFTVLVYPAYLEKNGKLLDDVIPPNVPCFVYVAADDTYSPSSRAIAIYCKENGIRCDFTQAEEGGHGFGIKKTLPKGVSDWPEKLKLFLDGI